MRSGSISNAASQSFVILESRRRDGVVRADDGRGDGGGCVVDGDAVVLRNYRLGGMVLRLWSAGLIAWRFVRWKQLTPDFADAVCDRGVRILIGAQFADFLFNAFPCPFFLMILNVGLIGAMQRFQPVRMVRRVMQAEPVMVPQGVMP